MSEPIVVPPNKDLMRAALFTALAEAQAEMPAVKPDANNPHFKSQFVSLDHLIASTRPVLNRHGLAVVQAPSHIDGHPALTTTLTHVSGESLSATMPLVLAGQDMQKLGAALTYARRYAWAAALGICADEDDDGNTASQKASASPAEGTTRTTPKEAAAGPQPPAAATPSDEQLRDREDALIETVKAKGGNVQATVTSIATALEEYSRADYVKWLEVSEKHWADASAFAAKAETAVKSRDKKTTGVEA